MDRFICPRCNGTGEEVVDDGDHLEMHACYHCSTQGFVDAESFRADRLVGLAVLIAGQMVSSEEREASEGEGWPLAAAEAGCSVADYRADRFAVAESKVAARLAELDARHPDVVRAMLDLWVPLDEDMRVKPSPEAPAPKSKGDESVPF